MAITGDSYLCPFCGHTSVPTDATHFVDTIRCQRGNKYGDLLLACAIFICANPKCKEISLSTSFAYGKNTYPEFTIYRTIATWNLIPPSKAKVFPDYIPEQIRKDYLEACLIRSGSPKASATLARRCLQGMIRDFWEIKKGRLNDEIQAIKEKVDPLTWKAIDAVRSIGNIGAHMEQDVNLIIEVEPEEADQLITLIETLLHDWYIVRHGRQIQMEELVRTAEAKKAIRN